jgi:glycosyltransferase involved in cell wall biosynthesis
VPTVAVDVTPLLGQRTGIGTAVAGFVGNLAGRREIDLVGYCLTLRGWRAMPGELPPGVRASGRPAPASALLRAWGAHDWPPAEWWTGRADVVHGTNFVVPPSRRAARLVSVWDMTAVRYPQLCTPTSLRYPHLVARAISGGAWVHTGASSVAAEIVDHFAIEADRVIVVAPAVETDSRQPPATPRQPVPAEGPAPASVDPAPHGPPYILALGRAEPRKDLPGLVRAFDLMAARLADVELVIAGPSGWGEEELAGAIAAAAHRDRIRRLGWTPRVSRLLAGAAVFAYPSIYEGFGLPPLEAMAVGVPVVATAAGAVPEVVGDAAELVAPGDPEALAGALESVLVDPARRDRLIAAGRDRVAYFSGDRAADGLVGAYQRLAGG